MPAKRVARKKSAPRRCKHGAPSERHCARVTKILKKWQRTLRMDAHTIEIRFEAHDSVDADTGDADRAADASTGYPYHRHDIRIFPSFWNFDPEAQEMALLHEMVHLILGGYDTLLCRAQEGQIPSDVMRKDIAEATADWLTRILWRGEVEQVRIGASRGVR